MIKKMRFTYVNETFHFKINKCKNSLFRVSRFGLSCDRFGLSCDRFGLSCDRFGLSCDRSGLSCVRFGLSCDRFGLTCDRFGLSCDRFGDTYLRELYDFWYNVTPINMTGTGLEDFARTINGKLINLREAYPMGEAKAELAAAVAYFHIAIGGTFDLSDNKISTIIAEKAAVPVEFTYVIQ